MVKINIFLMIIMFTLSCKTIKESDSLRLKLLLLPNNFDNSFCDSLPRNKLSFESYHYSKSIKSNIQLINKLVANLKKYEYENNTFSVISSEPKMCTLLKQELMVLKYSEKFSNLNNDQIFDLLLNSIKLDKYENDVLFFKFVKKIDVTSKVLNNFYLQDDTNKMYLLRSMCCAKNRDYFYDKLDLSRESNIVKKVYEYNKNNFKFLCKIGLH
jgi:hypothetical protein